MPAHAWDMLTAPIEREESSVRMPHHLSNDTMQKVLETLDIGRWYGQDEEGIEELTRRSFIQDILVEVIPSVDRGIKRTSEVRLFSGRRCKSVIDSTARVADAEANISAILDGREF